jgi:dTDP-4-amino-4,6-dideoxygalactose transaminase
MTDLQAAIAIPQIAKIDSIAASRAQNANRLIEGLRDVSGIRLPTVKPGRTHVWHQFTVVLDDSLDMTQDTFVSKMAAEGVSCGVYYPRLVFDYDCFRQNPLVVDGEFPNARSIARRCVSLPVHQHLSSGDADAIVGAVRQVLNG